MENVSIGKLEIDKNTDRRSKLCRRESPQASRTVIEENFSSGPPAFPALHWTVHLVGSGRQYIGHIL